MTISGNLFGVSINAKKLGVILDVSSTAHRTLGRALGEIEKNFPQAEMILMVGCGMSEIKRPKGRPEATIYPYEEKSMGVMTNFFNKDEKGETLRQGLNKRQNIYALRGTIYDALAAFDYLVDKRRVDTIYWFGDFTDAIDESISTTLTNKLVSEGVKVIAHNFQGRPTGPLVEKMAKKTGERTIEIVPGGKK